MKPSKDLSLCEKVRVTNLDLVKKIQGEGRKRKEGLTANIAKIF